MSNNETLADILAEMRSPFPPTMRSVQEALCNYADRIEAAAERRIASLNAALANCRKYAQKIERENDEGETRLDAEEIIATVDNAAKCIAQKALEGQQCTPPIAQKTPKSEQPGDAAALRAALEGVTHALCHLCICGCECESGKGERCAEVKAARAALAAPPRNCDRFAKWHEAWDAFRAEYGGPPDPGEMAYYFGVWLFAQTKGGKEC